MGWLPVARWKRVLLVQLLVLCALLGVVFYSCSGLAPLVAGQRVGPAVTIKLGFVSAYLLDAGDGQVALIDAGSDASGRELLAVLRARGVAPERVRAVFFTHGHADHTAAAPLFSQAETYALAEEVPLVEGRAGSASPMGRLRGPKPTSVRVTHPLRDGETINVNQLSVRVFALPGHTRGSAAYVVGSAVFLGDAASAGTTGRVFAPAWFFSENQAQGVASLHALASRLRNDGTVVNALVFAHSGPVLSPQALRALAEAE